MNAENIKSELQSIKFNEYQEPAENSTFEIDIDYYLRSKKEESIFSSIEDSISSTSRSFDQYLNDTVSLDWKARKDQICQVFGLSSIKSRNTEEVLFTSVPGWNKHSLGRSVLGPISGKEFADVETTGTNNPETIKKYIAVVKELNQARKSHKKFQASQKFYDVSRTVGGDVKAQQSQDIWRIIMEITGENSGQAVSARWYANSFSSKTTSQDLINLRRRITAGGKRFLEKQFFEQIEINIARNPIEAQLGGVPSVYNKVKAALNLQFTKDGKWNSDLALEIVNNLPIWALIYFLIRSGYLKEALDFAVSNREAFQKLGTSFPIYLKAFVESPVHVLPSTLLENIRKEFNEQVRFYDPESSDPYKFVLYKIIGRCELSKKSFPELVIRTTEDWLWIHFSLIYEDSNEISTLYDKYTLQNLQTAVTNYGSQYFDADNKSPALYVQVLMMCGLFEKAVQYAYTYSQIDAVHLAIALTYYGLLRPTSSPQEVLLNGDELNFARLMGSYTRDFRQTDPVEAVEYLVLISLNKDLPDGKDHLKMCHESLKGLVLETREFSKLLGDICQDGSRLPGAIEQRLSLIDLENVQQYLHAITEQAAIKAEEDGRIADAVLLYQLSEDYDTVVTIINKSLGEMLSVAQLGQPITPTTTESVPLVVATTDDPAQLARHVMEVYMGNISIYRRVKARNRETCATLLSIVNAWDAFARGDYDQCLRLVNDTNILMLDSNADVGMVRGRAQQFQTLHQSVARNIPALLVMVMRCCSTICERLNTSYYHNEGRHAKMLEMQGVSRNCMIYAGMIQYRMPREVFVELTNLEIRM